MQGITGRIGYDPSTHTIKSPSSDKPFFEICLKQENTMSEIVEFEGKKLRIITEGEWPEGVTLWCCDHQHLWDERSDISFLSDGIACSCEGDRTNEWLYWAIEVQDEKAEDVRSYNVGASDYAKHKIQPWDIWQEYKLDPWEADIIKRVLRKKQGESRKEKYLKIKHVAEEIIRQVEAGEHDDT